MIMEQVLKGLIGSSTIKYIDDIVVYSKDGKSHVQDLQAVFDRMCEYNFRLHAKKCVFGQ